MRFRDGTTTTTAEVTSSGQLTVIRPSTKSGPDASNAGNYSTTPMVVGITSAGVPTLRCPTISAYYRQNVNFETLLFYDNFASSASNTAAIAFNSSSNWSMATSSSTASTALQQMVLTSSTAASAAVRCTTKRQFSFVGITLQIEFRALFDQIYDGQYVYMGLANPPGATAISTNYVGFVINPMGGFGLQAFGRILNFTSPTPRFSHRYKLIITETLVIGYIDDLIVAELSSITMAAAPTTSLACGNVVFNIVADTSGRVPSGAIVLRIFDVSVKGLSGFGKHAFFAAGDQNVHCSQYYPRISTTLTSALYTNSLAAGAGTTPTNTTAALGSGLGGQFSVAIASAPLGSDWIVASFNNNPASGTPALMIKQIWFQASITTSFSVTTANLLYSLAYGSSTVSLATAAFRRIPLGADAMGLNAGTVGKAFSFSFDPPIKIATGFFMNLAVKNLAAANSLTGVFTFLVGFDGCWVV